ncbi:MAG: RluA family pseudouridine synthase [Candidatus Moranbacteria bacterium]|jgi:23S rRNA pseudouridine1911/1915/1917 synthase|nr:RluA family pseudouridine synthase [Candidatus Moranbacteria bacterium]
MKKEFEIEREQSGKRIDKALVNLKIDPEFSRADFSRAIKKGDVKVNGAIVKSGYVLKEGDVVSVDVAQKNKKTKATPNIKLEIIFEDENIIAVNKRAGIKIHPDSGEDENDTLVGGLLAKYPELTDIGDGAVDSFLRPGIVHRLDKDTSGVIIVARNQKAFEVLKEKFSKHEIEKKYLALVFGKLEKKKGTIDADIARSSTYRRQVIASKKTKTKIRTAITDYEVVQEFENYSLVEARPKTGRMHQIRIHLFSIGHPLIGDRLYRKKLFATSEFPSALRQMLHAEEIKLELFGKDYIFTAPIPEDFESLL